VLQYLVNKFGAASEVILMPGQYTGLKIVEMVEKLIDTIPTETKDASILIITAVANFAGAALARLDPSTKVVIPRMIQLLHDSEHGLIAAKSFRILLAPNHFLQLENGAIISKLRAARLFQLAVLPIARKWQASIESPYTTNYFIAIAEMIEYMPPEVFLAEENIDLMFIICLEGSLLSGHDGQRAVFLKALPKLTDLFPGKAEDHLDTLTVRMTDPFIPGSNASNVQCLVLGLEVLTSLAKEIPGISQKMTRNQRLASRLHIALPIALANPSRKVRKAAEQLKLALLLVES
jgi:hypothetical protein